MTMQTTMFESAQPTATLADAVGCAVFHDGEHGTIEAFLPDTYDCPMYKVRFGARVAILRPTEIGAR